MDGVINPSHEAKRELFRTSRAFVLRHRQHTGKLPLSGIVTLIETTHGETAAASFVDTIKATVNGR